MERLQEEIDVLRSSDVRYKAMVYDKLERVNQLENTLRGLDMERKAEIKQKDALIRDLYNALEKKDASYGGRSNRTAKTLSMQELDEVSFMLSTVNISNELLEESKKDSGQGIEMIEWDREREEWHEKEHSLLRRIQELEKQERDEKDREERYQRRISELEHFLKESKQREEKALKKMEVLERC